MNRKEYYEKNKEHIKAKSKQWSIDNKERKAQSSIEYRLTFKEKALLKAAKQRADKNGIPFNIEISDIIIPKYCPILGVTLESGIGKGRGNISRKYSPSLDRVIPSLGYIKGNIQVISWLANTMKSMATLDELIMFAKGILKMESRYESISSVE